MGVEVLGLEGGNSMDMKEYQQQWTELEMITDVRPVEVGYINETYWVTTQQHAYILRLYRNVHAYAHVDVEMEAMARLQAESLSFAIPLPLLTTKGQRVVYLQEGQQLATLSPVIAGRHPKGARKANGFAAGVACGELVDVFGTWTDAGFLAGQPTYGELHRVHPLVPVPREVIAKLPTTEEKKKRIERLLVEMEQEVPSLYNTLPQQPIHGDFTKGNTLLTEPTDASDATEEVKATAVLDFEFCGWDLRVIDLAVGLGEGPTNEMWGTGEEWVWIESFGRGYATKHRLTLAEIEALPTIMRLRRAYFLLHFMGRYLEGFDGEAWMRDIVDWVILLEDFMEAHHEDVVHKAKEWFQIASQTNQPSTRSQM
jgi:homoserine kinase type II